MSGIVDSVLVQEDRSTAVEYFDDAPLRAPEGDDGGGSVDVSVAAAAPLDQAAAAADDEVAERYERVVRQLEAHVKAQSREIEFLRSALAGDSGVGQDDEICWRLQQQQRGQRRREARAAAEEDEEEESPILSPSTPPLPEPSPRKPLPLPFTSARKLPPHWHEVVEEHALALFRRHVQRMDERIAATIAARVRRVNRAHVEASVKREVARYMRDAALSPAHPLHGWADARERRGARVMPSMAATLPHQRKDAQPRRRRNPREGLLGRTGSSDQGVEDDDDALDVDAFGSVEAIHAAPSLSAPRLARAAGRENRRTTTTARELMDQDDLLVQLEMERLRRRVAEVEQRHDMLLSARQRASPLSAAASAASETPGVSAEKSEPLLLPGSPTITSDDVAQLVAQLRRR